MSIRLRLEKVKANNLWKYTMKKEIDDEDKKLLEEEIDKLYEEECIEHNHNRVDEIFVDGLHRPIGHLEIKHNRVSWAPEGSEVAYVLPIREFSKLMKSHCASPENQRDYDGSDRDYTPLMPPFALCVEQLQPEQLAQLSRLNARLKAIEQQIVTQVQPQLDALNARVEDPNDWLEDYECECVLMFSIGKNDPDYSENSDNFIVKEKIYILKDEPVYESLLINGTNWNMFEHKENHPMRDEHHCHLYHSLYDHHDLGWINLLRIDEVWMDIKFIYQHWENNLGGKL